MAAANPARSPVLLLLCAMQHTTNGCEFSGVRQQQQEQDLRYGIRQRVSGKIAGNKSVMMVIMFLNMGSLQAALPNPPMPAFPSSLNTSWFPQNPAPPFMPAVPQGGLAYMGGQGPTSQLPNLASQGSVVPLGGNPFA